MNIKKTPLFTALILLSLPFSYIKSMPAKVAQKYSFPVQELTSLSNGSLYCVRNSINPIIDETSELPEYRYARLINLTQWIKWNNIPISDKTLKCWLQELEVPFYIIIEASTYSDASKPALLSFNTGDCSTSYDFPEHYVFCTNDVYQFNIEQNIFGMDEHFPIIFIPKNTIAKYVRVPFSVGNDTLWLTIPTP